MVWKVRAPRHDPLSTPGIHDELSVRRVDDRHTAGGHSGSAQRRRCDEIRNKVKRDNRVYEVMPALRRAKTDQQQDNTYVKHKPEAWFLFGTFPTLGFDDYILVGVVQFEGFVLVIFIRFLCCSFLFVFYFISGHAFRSLTPLLGISGWITHSTSAKCMSNFISCYLEASLPFGFNWVRKHSSRCAC